MTGNSSVDICHQPKTQLRVADHPLEDGSRFAGDPRAVPNKQDARACGAARRVIFTGDLPGSNPRLWSDDGQPFRNRIREGLPTIRPGPRVCRACARFRAEVLVQLNDFVAVLDFLQVKDDRFVPRTQPTV